MKRYILLLLVILCVVGTYAQSGMTDTQVMEFVAKEYNKGTSQAQIVTKLMQNGVDISQIRRVKATYEKMKKGNSGASRGGGKSTTTNRNRAQGSPKIFRNQVYDDSMDEYTTTQRSKKYSSKRLSPGYDPYLYGETEEDMDMDWIPNDTASMYKLLIKEMTKNRKKVWGRDIFNNEELSFEPNMNMPLPPNYRLGPGDAVFIDIYGASQKSYETTVAPDGIITIEGFGPIQVSGLTVKQANNKIKQKLGKRYSSSNIRLSVGETHSIMVNVLGEVKTPGTYTVSAFSTVFNALYMAGGIGELGTVRNIKVYRRGRLISTVDIYQFLLQGNLSGNVKLADNDVIVVGAYDVLVNISGKVKRPMYYEMKQGETLGTVIKYAGGFTGGAYTKNVRVNRKTGRKYSIFNVNEFDMNKFTMSDEDSITVDSVIPRYENMVEIKGAVFRPGMYEVGGQINSIRSLVESAEGLTEVAFGQHAILHRLKADRTLEVISVDIDGILLGKVADIPLQNEDVLFVPTRTDVQEEKTIVIFGEVQYPGTYKYADNETLEDFILQAGGLKQTASTVRVDVSRRIVNPQALQTDSIISQSFTFALKDGFVIDGQPGFTLAPFDQVFVRKSPGTTRQQNVSIEGEVLFAGNYSLSGRNTRLSDIFKAAGGATDLAYIKGARLERVPNQVERMRMEAVYKMQKEEENKNLLALAAKSSNASSILQASQQTQQALLKKFEIPSSYPVGIELDKALAAPGSDADLILREGDRIIIPQYNGTVKINGAVMYPNSVSYREGKNVAYYINQAGGFASDAKKSRTYILYMNGTLTKVGHNAKVLPGCEIIVPTKSHVKLSIAELTALGSSASGLAAIIATLANILR